MINFIKNLFTRKPAHDFAAIIAQGASIIDVRTTSEFARGHIRRSTNIPLDVLATQLGKIPKDKPVITCCASGMRSAAARGMLLKQGYSPVYNGGNWRDLEQFAE